VPWLHVDRAARTVLDGGVIAYPTEGVYGLGCLPGNRDAVERILVIKRRSWRKGLLLIAADVEQLEPLIVLPEGPLSDTILASWPGPTTWVLEAKPGVPRWLTGGKDTLGVRVTTHPIARRLCQRVNGPLVSTSANRSGRPPLRRVLLVRRNFGALVDYVVPGALGGDRGPTAIKDGRTGRLLRPS
jgi:L-threonylcarbamoyladenylate synthase